MKVFLARANSPLTVTPVPLGLGYLAHALKTRRGDAVMVVDGRRDRLPPDRIVDAAIEFGAQAVGLTAMTFEAPETLELIERFKRRSPAPPVILGGPHATGYGPSLLERARADYLVIGEGEDALVELLDALERGGDVSAVRGVAWRRAGAAVFNGGRTEVAAVGELGVDWESIHAKRYFSSWRRNAMNTVAVSDRRLPVFFTRGCPFGCAYCHQIFGRKYRTFPVERVVDEMVRLRDAYGLKEFEIIDDTFNLKLDHAKAAMEEVVRRRLGCALAFANGLRADRMDEELLGLMRRAGVYRIDYAIETASPRLQKRLHKNVDLERAREVVNQTARTGIVTGAYYMLGFPTETEEEMRATIEYALKLENQISSFFYLLPFPGTEIAESDPEVARTVRAINLRDASGLAVNLSAAPDATVAAIRREGYRRFYFSPRRIAKIARAVPINLRLFASAWAAFQLATREGVNY